MSRKVNIYKTEADVTAINLDVYDAEIILEPSEENCLTAEFVNCPKIQAANSDSALFIKQSKRAFAALFPKGTIKIGVPDYIVPAVSVTGNRVKIYAKGGIYSQWEALAENGCVTLEDVAPDGIEIKGGNVSLYASGVTVKNSVITNVKSGDAALENCFATHMVCRTGKGNIGVSNLICRDATLESDGGNITATVKGDENSYNVTLTARSGLCNRENRNTDGETSSFKAYTAKGNIHVDFIDDKGEQLPEVDPVDQEAAAAQAAQEN